MKKAFGKIFKSRKRIVIFTAGLVTVCAVAAFIIIKQRKAGADTLDMPQGGTVGYVTRGSISNELSSSGTLSPKNTYSITSLVSGEIITADFEEGDQVTAGQTLFVIDTSEISSDIDSAARSLEKAQKSYDDAISDRDKALAKLNNGTVLSSKSGYVRNITVKSGDSVGKDTKIAELYNDAQMSFRAAFLDTDAAQLIVGQDMFVEVNDTGEVVPGKIKAISDLTETLSGGIPVKYIEIYVTNPGGITDSDTANAYMGDIHSLSSGTFTAMKSEDFKTDITQNVTVADVLVTEGQYVTSGTPLFTVTADSLKDALKNINDAADNAEDSLKSAENQKTKLDETIDKYTITAPISGQVITKNLQAGEKVNNSGSNTSQLALIYDLSELTFQMSIDELDISKVKVGQDVKVTADAFEGQSFKGHVTNVGLNGTASNGVTTYPVVVTLDDSEGLLPGMNVDGTIILESAEDTLIVPSGALQRGNIVYVKDDGAAGSTSAAGNDNAADMSQLPEPQAESDEQAQGTGDDRGTGAPGDTGRESGGKGSGGHSGSPSGSHGSGSSGSHGSGHGKGGSDGAGGNMGGSDIGILGSITDGDTGKEAESSDTSAMQYLGDVPDGYKAVQVTTGIISSNYVEILSGLEEGQEIYVKDSVASGSDWDDMYMYGGPGGGHDGGGPGGP